MQAAHIGNYGRKRVYYVIDGTADSDCLLLSPNGDTQLTSFISFISKTPNIEIIDNSKFGDFVWHGAKGDMSQRWHDVFISKVLPPPEEAILSVAIVTEFPRKRQAQIKKYANAALEFKTLSQSGLGEKAIGRRLANNFRSRTGRNITGGIRGFVRDAVYDARAIDADDDGWIQEGTQFARRAVQRVEEDIAQGSRGLASIARGTWGRSNNPKTQEKMNAYRDSVSHMNILNTVKNIENSVNETFFDGKPILTHADARTALAKAFPDQRQMEIDFLGLNTPSRVPRQRDLSPNEQSAVYSLLYASMLNDDVSKWNIRAWSDKYRTKYNNEQVSDSAGASMAAKSGSRFSAGRLIKKYKNRLDLMYREDASSRNIPYFKKIISDLLEGRDPTNVRAFPHIASEKVSHLLIGLVNEDKSTIESALGITIDGMDNDAIAQKMAESIVDYVYKFSMYHEAFHGLHNVASDKSGAQKIKDKFPYGNPFDNMEDFFSTEFADTLSDRARLRLVASHQSSNLAGNLQSGTMNIIATWANSIVPYMNSISEARRLVSRGDDQASIAARLNQQFGTTFSPDEMTLGSLDKIQEKIDDFLGFTNNTDLKDSSGRTLKLSPTMIRFLKDRSMSNSLYAKLSETGQYNKQVGDSLTAVELISFFEPTIVIPLGNIKNKNVVMITSWLGLSDQNRIDGPSTADSLEVQKIDIDDNNSLMRAHVGRYTLMDLLLNGPFPYDDRYSQIAPPELTKNDTKTIIHALAKLNSAMLNDVRNGITDPTKMTLKDQRLISGIDYLDNNPMLKDQIDKAVSQLYEDASIDHSSLKYILDQISSHTGNQFDRLGQIRQLSMDNPSEDIPTDVHFSLQQALGRLDELDHTEIENLLALISRLNGGKYKNYSMYKYPVSQLSLLQHILDGDIQEFIAELGVAHTSGTTVGYTGSRYRETRFSSAEAAVIRKIFKWLAPNAEPNFILKMRDGK